MCVCVLAGAIEGGVKIVRMGDGVENRQEARL